MGAIDLNCDLGESYGAWTIGDDAAMLGLVTSANVACGFHAGDPQTLRRTCDLAAAAGVVVGAQVAYPDLVGFGRRRLNMEPAELRDSVTYQIGGLDGIATAAGTVVRYVKPHGALYHAAAGDTVVAGAVIAGVTGYGRPLPVVGPPGSLLLRAAEAAGLPTVAEGFADRAYRPDGGLVARSEPGSVLTDPALVGARSVALARGDGVESLDGEHVELNVDTLCLHGDTPGAVALGEAVRRALDEAGITVASFVR